MLTALKIARVLYVLLKAGEGLGLRNVTDHPIETLEALLQHLTKKADVAAIVKNIGRV